MNLFKARVISLTEHKGKKTEMTLFTQDHFAVRGTFEIKEAVYFPENDPVFKAIELLKRGVKK